MLKHQLLLPEGIPSRTRCAAERQTSIMVARSIRISPNMEAIGLDDSRQSISRLGESEAFLLICNSSKAITEDCPTGDGHR